MRFVPDNSRLSGISMWSCELYLQVHEAACPEMYNICILRFENTHTIWIIFYLKQNQCNKLQKYTDKFANKYRYYLICKNINIYILLCTWFTHLDPLSQCMHEHNGLKQHFAIISHPFQLSQYFNTHHSQIFHMFYIRYCTQHRQTSAG